MEAQGNGTMQPIVENLAVDAVGHELPVAAPMEEPRADPTIAILPGPATALVPTASAGTTIAILAAPVTEPVAPLLVAPDPAPALAPVVGPVAALVMGPPALAPASAPVVVPVVAPVMVRHAGQFMANLARAPIQPPDAFDLDAALGASDPPKKSDTHYKLWRKL
ncbi:hypothetical protein M758_12G107100 [Ceratodon purpureus]|nr:hypothetical protein M758_12G107100 [Ceratodon purpureus]